jgi:hypothetical protein
MAYSIIQHIDPAGSGQSTSATTGATTALVWPQKTLAGSLLVAGLSLGSALSATCITPNWRLATGSAGPAQIWYNPYAHGNDLAPVFVTNVSTAYSLQIAEIGGITNAQFDVAGSNTGSNVASLTTAVSSPTKFASEFIFGVSNIGNNSSGTVGVTASSAAGSATIGGDIDNQPADGAVLGQGGATNWATTGALGTSPSLTFNYDRSTLMAVSVVVASFIGTTTMGFLRGNNLRPHPFSPGLAR